jgi:hypothetical protein
MSNFRTIDRETGRVFASSIRERVASREASGTFRWDDLSPLAPSIKVRVLLLNFIGCGLASGPGTERRAWYYSAHQDMCAGAL